MSKNRHSYTVEFKKNAVSLVLDEHRKPAEVARSLGISPKTMHTWLRQQREGSLCGKIASQVTDEAMENSRLQIRIKKLEAENRLLKKFNAYLARNGLA